MTGGGSVLRIEGSQHSNLETGAPMSEKPISPLRQRMLEDMSLRGFTPDTQRDYIRAVKKLAAFLGRSPDTATAEDLRAFQLHLTATGVQPPDHQRDGDGAAVLLQGDARPAGDDATSRIRLRAAQAAARALPRGGCCVCWRQPPVPNTRRRSALLTGPACG